MKDQYFGDVNDFVKYSLLRAISKDVRPNMAVCWTLTENDASPDGSKVSYLRDPKRWRHRDPVVFDCLHEHVVRRRVRSVAVVERSRVVPNCRFFKRKLSDDASRRARYFDAFFQFASGADFVFFDPDNGLGVKSVPLGRKGSSRYLYVSELRRAYAAGHSVVFYQHFPRQSRDTFLAQLAAKLSSLRNLKIVVTASTGHVTFVLLPQPSLEGRVCQAASKFASRWGQLVRLASFETRALAGANTAAAI